MGYGIEFLVALIILLTGARNDLLDALRTDAYWHAKNVTVTVEQLEHDAGPDEHLDAIDDLLTQLESPQFKIRDEAKKKLAAMGSPILPQLQKAMDSKNPEVRAVAGEIARQFEAKGKERSIRRLMAIRTLGERRETTALPLLKSLEHSTEMFVADYARRAVAQIEGRPWQPPDRSADFRKDILLLPRHTGIVGQTTGLAFAPETLAKVAPGHGPDADDLKTKQMQLLLPLLERIGNVRVDGVTAALSDDAGETTGWELTLIRGQFDAHALLAAARVLSRPADGVVKYGVFHDIPIVQTDVDTHIMFPSDQLMIIVMADEDKDRFARMLGMFYALQAGHGTITNDKDINALIAKTDTKAPLWLAGSFNAEEKRTKMLAGIDSFTLTGAKKNESMALTLRAQGADATDFKASIDEFNSDIQWLKGVMPAAAGPLALQPLVDLVGSVHTAVDPNGKDATATAEMKADVAPTVLRGLLQILDIHPNEPVQQPGGPIAPNAPVAVPAP